MKPADSPGLNDYWTFIITIALFFAIFLLIRYLQKRG